MVCPFKTAQCSNDLPWLTMTISSLNVYIYIPSGKHTKNYGKSPFLINGFPSINGHFSCFFYVYQRLNLVISLQFHGFPRRKKRRLRRGLRLGFHRAGARGAAHGHRAQDRRAGPVGRKVFIGVGVGRWLYGDMVTVAPVNWYPPSHSHGIMELRSH